MPLESPDQPTQKRPGRSAHWPALKEVFAQIPPLLSGPSQPIAQPPCSRPVAFPLFAPGLWPTPARSAVLSRSNEKPPPKAPVAERIPAAEVRLLPRPPWGPDQPKPRRSKTPALQIVPVGLWTFPPGQTRSRDHFPPKSRSAFPRPHHGAIRATIV